MLKEVNKKIEKIIDAENIFQYLIEMLEYKNSPNFHYLENDEDYDAEYIIEVENKKYTIIGLKIFKNYNEESIVKQHLKYWNRNDVPFSILVLPGEIRIYNNFTIDNNKLLYKTGDGQESVLKIFANKNIINGVLWEKYNSILRKGSRVDKYLLQNMRNTIVNLYKNHNMQLGDAYNFLAQCIFIKYLEDRQMLTSKAFADYGVEGFIDLLCMENVEYIKDFFAKLKTWFNGDLFDIDNIVLPTVEQLRIVKSFFDADEICVDGMVQITFYKYDFSKIPIELISNIYETFFNLEDSMTEGKYSSENGAYYTPYFLADFMNDWCLEKLDNFKSPVVMDPACGSGVFLVGAFKKIVEQRYSANQVIKPEELSEILLNNIYGIDKNLKALKLACFSLYIALLEYLTPKDILENEFKFPNLMGKTLFEKNFFDDELDNIGIHADIIIGNPPWVSDKDVMHNKYCKERNIPISDKQIAQAFIVRAKDFANQNAIVSLLVTNSIFTNENAEMFRKYLLQNYRLLEVFNLYGIKSTLFSHAKAPCSILTYKCENQEKSYCFNYFAFRSNLISDVFQKIVYDYEKIIRIKNTNIIDNSYIWRVLNHGDEYDTRVIKKMKLFPPVSERGYEYFRGYAVGSKNKKNVPKFLEYKGGNLKEGYHQYLINYEALTQMTQSEFERPRELEGYLCKNKLLIKRTQNEKLSGAAFCAEPIIFCDDYHCLYDLTGQDENDLKILEAYFNSNLFRYYRFFACKEASAIKPEISKGDIMSFPVPNNISEGDRKQLLNLISEIEEVLKEKYSQTILVSSEFDIKVQEKQEQIDNIIFNTYELDEVERATVKYALEYVIPKKTKKNLIMSESYMRDVYNDYIEYMENYFNNFLLDNGFKLQHTEVHSDNLYTLIGFAVSEADKTHIENDVNILKNTIDILGLSSIDNINNELIVKNRLSGFYNDGFFVIKEKEVRNWTMMSAVKDADYFAKLILREEEVYEE